MKILGNFVLVIFCISGSFAEDPDVSKNVTELIRSKGFKVEDHDVVTTDHYILTMQHILPATKGNFSANNTQVVLLQHGLLGASSDWVLNFRNQSLGFVLADLGYDVWLGNVRGNTYGKKHKKFWIRSDNFWSFTFDDMAQKDLPAMIDYVLNQTRKKELIYIAHSQGTTMGFGLLSEKKEYNAKIKLFVGLGPVTHADHITSPIRYLAPFADDIELIFSLFGKQEFLPSSVIIKLLSKFCPKILTSLCSNIFFIFNGIDPKQLNTTRIPVYAAHDPAGTSVMNLVHWAQAIESGKFQKFDFGRKKNMKMYNQKTPPQYNMKNIKTPVALFWGLNDNMAHPVDVHVLNKRLPNVVYNYMIPNHEWGHLDFMIGKDANKFVFPAIVDLMKSY